MALVTFLLTVGGYLNGFDPAVEGLQLAERYTWLPDLGLAALAAWPVEADGISMPLFLLTSLITALSPSLRRAPPTEFEGSGQRFEDHELVP